MLATASMLLMVPICPARDATVASASLEISAAGNCDSAAWAGEAPTALTTNAPSASASNKTVRPMGTMFQPMHVLVVMRTVLPPSRNLAEPSWPTTIVPQGAEQYQEADESGGQKEMRRRCTGCNWDPPVAPNCLDASMLSRVFSRSVGRGRGRGIA